MSNKIINLNGITVAYNEKGKGSPIILLHGFCGSKGIGIIRLLRYQNNIE